MDAVDTSILVAALVENEPEHNVCAAILEKRDLCVYSHGLVEIFNTLTGGRSGYRIPANQVAEMIQHGILPFVKVTHFSTKEMLVAMQETQTRGVRGAAIFDYLHLASARKARAGCLYTLDTTDFQSFHRPGDPEIVRP